MNDKYAKEITKELRLIRIELQKLTTTAGQSSEKHSIEIDGVSDESRKNLEREIAAHKRAGAKVTIK